MTSIDRRQNEEQSDLFSSASDITAARFLLADLHDDLAGKTHRFRFLADIGDQLGASGTMLFGGQTSYYAWVEARSSFVHGNFVATVMLCQALVENLLAAFLHGGLMDELPHRVHFEETLRRCQSKDLLTDQDVADLRRLVGLRNPLTHFRDVNDGQNLDRRSIEARQHAADLLARDAWFAIGLAVRIMAKRQFRLG